MSDTNATDDVVEENAWLDDFENEVVTPAWEEEIDDSSDVIEGDIVTDDDLDLVGIAPSAALDINGTDPLDANQAKELTEYIRSTSNVLYVLIERAHSGKAHTALGYKTFEEYVRAEFDISRSRAYQLLNQSRVISELESALPEGTPVHITEAAARDLKHALDDLVPEIRERTADLTPDVAGEVLEEMVANYREEKLRAREEAEEEDFEDDEPAYTGTGDGTYQGGYDEDEEDLDLDDSDLDDILAFDDDPEEVRKNYKLVYELYASLTAISSLSSAPDVQKLIDIIPPERRFQIDDSLPKSLEWMTNFAEVWNSQPWKQASEENNNLDLEEDVDVDFDEDFTDISDENL